MGIVAVLLLISATGLISARDQEIVSGATEQILSSIREAQNFSISVRDGAPANTSETKVWGVKFAANSNQYDTVYFEALPGATDTVSVATFSTTPLSPGVSITTKYSNGSNDPSNRYVFFSAPFGAASTGTGGCTNSKISGSCYWSEGNRPDKSWVISNGGFVLEEDFVKITVNYKGKSQSIIVNSSGDSKIAD